MISRIILTALVLGFIQASGDDRADGKFLPQEPAQPKDLMRAKLAHSQKVLEGVATSDFGQIAKHAEELIAISKALEWQVIKTARYQLHSSEFRRSAELLMEQAKDKNLDGAALAYVDLTLNCVKCHKYVRTHPEEK